MRQRVFLTRVETIEVEIGFFIKPRAKEEVEAMFNSTIGFGDDRNEILRRETSPWKAGKADPAFCKCEEPTTAQAAPKRKHVAKVKPTVASSAKPRR